MRRGVRIVKKVSAVALPLVLSLMLAGCVKIIEVPDPGAQYWDDNAKAIAASARNGLPDNTLQKTNFAVGLGVTRLNTASNIYLAIIPSPGETFWHYNATYHFTLKYDPSDSLTVRFTISGQPPYPYFEGQPYYGPAYSNGFHTIRFNYAGRLTPDGKNFIGVKISNLKLNNIIMGSGNYESGPSNKFVYFANANGAPFASFTIEGDFTFTGGVNGVADLPRFEINLGNPVIP
jgi:hypothetical protein